MASQHFTEVGCVQPQQSSQRTERAEAKMRHAAGSFETGATMKQLKTLAGRIAKVAWTERPTFWISSLCRTSSNAQPGLALSKYLETSHCEPRRTGCVYPVAVAVPTAKGEANPLSILNGISKALGIRRCTG